MSISDIDKKDSLEILLYLRDNDLPEENERTEILKKLYNNNLFYIYFDDICRYSKSFREKYTLDYIRTLFRKANIQGRDLETELSVSGLSDEDKYLIRLFFKGRW